MNRKKTGKDFASLREQEIGARLKIVREKLGFSQQAVADRIAISRERLASYETGRVPIRYDIALVMCRKFIIGEKWLATGQGNPRQYLSLKPEHFPHLAGQIKTDSPFSEAYDQHLAQGYDIRLKRWNASAIVMFNPTDDLSVLETIFNYCIDIWKRDLGPERSAEMFNYLLNKAYKFGMEVKIKGKCSDPDVEFKADPKIGHYFELPLPKDGDV